MQLGSQGGAGLRAIPRATPNGPLDAPPLGMPLPPADASDPVIGTVIGRRFAVEARLGRGAMGAVYRARHVRFGRAFAVKLPHAGLWSEPAVRQRFAREAELAGQLHHPNVVAVVDHGETGDGACYLVMDYAPGPTLAELMGHGPLPRARVIDLLGQLCDGLAHAHELGLIHRDFKPENVIVEQLAGGERPRIIDFGIALRRDETGGAAPDELARAGMVLGTPHYMAPEHACDEPLDHRIDLFALGVVAYEMLTGRLPFDGDGLEVARANMCQPTPAMADRAPGVDVDPLLEAFTAMLLAKDPVDRPASAREARRLLELIERDPERAASALGLAPRPAPVLPVAHSVPRVHARRRLELAAGIACAVLAALATFAWMTP